MRLWYICIHYHVTIITWYFNFEAYFRRWSWARWRCRRCYTALWLHLVDIRFIISWFDFRCILHYLIEIGLKAEFAATECWLLIGWWWSFGIRLIWRNDRIYRYLRIWAFVNFLNMYKGHMSIFIVFSAKSFITNLAFKWSFFGMNNFVVFQMRKTASKCSKLFQKNTDGSWLNNGVLGFQS